MESRALGCGLVLAVLFAHAAEAQFSIALPPLPKAPGLTSAGAAGSGGFLMGADDCAAPHTLVPAGTQLGVPFTTGTTGAQGQNEPLCYTFGASGLANDVWFDWQATATLNVAMTTCAGTAIDTKIAAYPLNLATCPANGTALACNDDACGLQSTITWPVVAGTSYTLQLGTFPGAAGGSGTFDITQVAPLPCGQYDDGVPENALGLTTGGETGWMHRVDCLSVVDNVATAYGLPGGGAPPVGAPSSIAVYEDSDCDGSATTGLVLRHSIATTVTNPGTLILNPNPIVPPVSIPTRCSFVLASCQHPAGQFPGAMDQSNPTPAAWIVGDTTGAGGVLDLVNLNANNVPPVAMQSIGFPTAWLLRATGTQSPSGPYPAQCFGAGCPCTNDSASGGCDNSLGGTSGALLSGSGSASLASDTLVLTVANTPNQPGIFFQGNNFLSPAPSFGDGLRCCGGNVVRCGTYLPAGLTTNTGNGNLIGGNAPPISDIGPNVNLVPGDVRCYQWWYRDPSGGPCATGFNLSNSISVTWSA